LTLRALPELRRYVDAETVRAAGTAAALLLENQRLDAELRASVSAGTGLRGLCDRVAALSGTLELSSPRGSGTCLRARLPCG